MEGVRPPRNPHLHVKRLRVPERCRQAPDCHLDRNFGIYLCDVKILPCHYRGTVFVLDQDGRRFECRKAELPSSDA